LTAVTDPLLQRIRIINEVGRSENNTVKFSCTFEGGAAAYHFPVPDAKTAGQLVSILAKHKGEALISIADEPIPED
jgi:hypothetical protein